MLISWHGNASLTIENGGDKIAFDPFFALTKSGREDSFDEMLPSGVNEIFVTHGHVDHIDSLPEIASRLPNARIHCTETPARSLVLDGVPKKNIRLIRPGNRVKVGSLTVEAIKGKHIAFSPQIVLKTFVSDRVLEYPANFAYLLKQNAKYKERGETLAYLVSGGGRRILLLGSLGLAPDTDYPDGCDLLVLPYQGATEDTLFREAMRITRKLHPRRVLLDHFNDAFPPVSRDIETWPFELAATRFTRVIYPERNQKIEV